MVAKPDIVAKCDMVATYEMGNNHVVSTFYLMASHVTKKYNFHDPRLKSTNVIPQCRRIIFMSAVVVSSLLILCQQVVLVTRWFRTYYTVYTYLSHCT